MAKRHRPEWQKPTIDEVAIYCKARDNGIDPESFWHWYESNGWMVGSNPMVSWKSAIVTWEKRNRGVQVSAKAFENVRRH